MIVQYAAACSVLCSITNILYMYTCISPILVHSLLNLCVMFVFSCKMRQPLKNLFGCLDFIVFNCGVVSTDKVEL